MVGEEEICASCANEETVICCRYGECIYQDDNAGDEHTPLCRDCFDRSYTTCERCDRVIHNDVIHYTGDDEDEVLCPSCFARASTERVIQDYCYTPEPIFYGDGNRYLGVELEIDRGGELSSNSSINATKPTGEKKVLLNTTADIEVNDLLPISNSPDNLFVTADEHFLFYDANRAVRMISKNPKYTG